MIFIYLQSFIHHFTGLFRTNIITSSQLAYQLSSQSTAPVSQRSWVQILCRPEFFFRPYFHCFLNKKCSLLPRSLSYSFLYPKFIYMTFTYLQSFISHFIILFGTNIMTSCQLACQLSWQSTALVSQSSQIQILYRPYFHYCSNSVHYCKDHFHIHLINYLYVHHTSGTCVTSESFCSFSTSTCLLSLLSSSL